MKRLLPGHTSAVVVCILSLGLYGGAYTSVPIQPLAQTYSTTATTNRSLSGTADDTNEGTTSMTAGIWSPLLEEWALSVVPRDQKVMKNKPYIITRPADKPPGGAGKEVTETDLYLLGAIEKLVYRVDFMEKRLRRTEELIHHVMANSNQRQEPCPTNFSRVGAYCYHFSERELNWKSSASICRALGSRLAEFETVEENQDIVAYMQTTSALQGKDFWTGGLNPGLLWIWSNSARPVDSNSTTNPSHTNSIKGNGRCLKLAYNPSLRGYEYQGSECSVRASYICEYEENSTSRALERIQKSLQEKFPERGPKTVKF
ncbi:hypothetical protein Cfor_02026 [Coptotermes formosanus]|uniref:C-type lectin domain-containing protein n=1 Tax=Coptotermes formosanus TaxID=36987 RepID=A0A6L2PYF4_COPFO|nr:hypothetical protein Cfor_02026 [Coptotermes formosanus]